MDKYLLEKNLYPTESRVGPVKRYRSTRRQEDESPGRSQKPIGQGQITQMTLVLMLKQKIP